MPWWVYLIIFLLIFYVVYLIRMIRMKINTQSDPNKARILAKKYYEKDVYSLKEYREALEDIIRKHHNLDTILMLMHTYNKDDDKDKYEYWQEAAAKAGDMECFIEHYGFSDYAIASTSYNEMLEALNKVKAYSYTEKKALGYIKGIVYFQADRISEARNEFLRCVNGDPTETLNESRYMLMRCYLRENNFPEAEVLYSLLSKEDFQMPCNGYLEMFKYCSPEHDEARTEYAQLYMNCPEADVNSAECTEIQRFLGEKYWFGDARRKYITANKYLLSAAGKGDAKSEKILEKYGVDGVLTEPVNAGNKTYHFLYGYELTAPKRLFAWLQIAYAFEFKKSLLHTEFVNEYISSFHSLQDVANGVTGLYADSLAKMIDWGIKLLMHFGIDSYSGRDILDMCGDLSLLPRVPRFEQQLDAIDRRAAELNMKTEYTKATRGYWTGAGFGTTIGGTIAASAKASVAAGVMNIGSGILHGIGDSIVGAINNSELKGMEQKVFMSPMTLNDFTRALQSACSDIKIVFLKIIFNEVFQQSELRLSGKVIYKNENLAELDDRILDTKIQNHTNARNWEYVYSLTVEQLRRDPLNEDVFKSLSDLTQRLHYENSEEPKKSLKEYAKDFRFNIE